MKHATAARSPNRLLCVLAPREFKRLRKYLEPVSLSLRDLLSKMLGVRRVGVTVAAGALEHAAGNCYKVVRAALLKGNGAIQGYAACCNAGAGACAALDSAA